MLEVASLMTNLVLDLPTDAIGENQIVRVSYEVPTSGTAIVDIAGNKAKGFTKRPVTNDSTVTNTTPPVLVSAEVPATGRQLSLVFNEDLDLTPSTPPPASAFTVTADGIKVEVLLVVVSTLTDLTLDFPMGAIGQNQIVTVSYKKPTGVNDTVIADLDGNETKAFTFTEVVNSSTVDKTPPELASAEVPATGRQLSLVFNEDLDLTPSTPPPASAFTVTADGIKVKVLLVVVSTLTDLTLDFPMGAIGQNQIVTVSYEKPTGVNDTVIADTDGNETKAFTFTEVVNNSTVDKTPPVLVSAEVPATGRQLSLVFNEDLDLTPSTPPPASAFTVTADGIKVKVLLVVVSTLTDLTLDFPMGAIGQNQIVTVSYEKPTGVNDTVIADTDGNETEAFTFTEVTNNSTVANTTPPVPASATVPATGDRLNLVFNEDLDIGAAKLPPAIAFTVTADGGSAGTVQSVSFVSSTSFTLGLSTGAIEAGQIVTVSYAVPDSGTVIADPEGNETKAFTFTEVVNNSTVANTTPPVPVTVPVTVTPLSLTVAEGASETYTVVLTSQPTDDVTVRVGGHAGTDLTVSPDELVFTTTNWGGLRTVTVTAGEDGDAADETVTLTHAATGGGFGGYVLPKVAVTIADNDEAAPVTGCPADSDWCATLTVAEHRGWSGTSYGFKANMFGALDDRTIDHDGSTLALGRLVIWMEDRGPDYVAIQFQGARAPHGTVFTLRGRRFITSPASDHGTDTHRWPRPEEFLWWGGREVAVSAKLPDGPGNVAHAPTGLTATERGAPRIDLAWSAPADDGGQIIVGYRIEAATDGGRAFEVLVDDTGSDETSWSHSGLTTGDTRHYRVRALNAVGASPPSNIVGATTGAVTNPNAAPEYASGRADIDLASRAIPEGRAIGAPLTAVDPNGDALTYTLEPHPQTTNAAHAIQLFAIDADTGQLRAAASLDHQSWNPWWVLVKADDGRGGTASRTVRVRLPGIAADAPYGMSCFSTPVAEDGTRLTAQCKLSAADAGNAPIRHVDIRYQTGGYFDIHFPGPQGQDPGSVLEGRIRHEVDVTVLELSPNTRYVVSARAVTDAGPGRWGSGNYVTTADTGPATATQVVAEPLTARFEDVPATHDGETRFTVRFALSEPVGNALTDIRDNAFTVTGARIAEVERVGTTGDAWLLSIEPDGTGDVQIAIAPALDCATPGALCTSDGRGLSNGLAMRIGGPEETTPVAGPRPLTARFENLPAEHTGRKFKVHVVFSEALTDTKGVMMRAALDVSGGRAMGSRRVDGSWAHRTVTVKPDGFGAVTVSLVPKTDCAAPRAICTDAGEPLTNLISARIQGPVTLSVADARVREAPGAALEFEVTLNRVASGTVFVDYATFDGTARAGADYTGVWGRLRFVPGETAKTVRVNVLDDSHDEGEETLTLRLARANGAVIGDGEATGTIENSDSMPAAWLARFGRTVAEQVVEAAEIRLRAPPPAGVAVRLAGQTIGGAAPLDEDAQADAEAQARLESLSRWLRDENDEENRRVGSRQVTPRDLLTGTSFALAAGTEDGGMAGLWGRGAVSRFNGQEGELSLDGEVTSAMLGADWSRGPWAAGLMVSHARGEGGYRGADSGTVESTLTGLYPYGRHAVNDRVTLWGVAGYGAGTLTLTPDGQEGIETDIDLTMAAVGLRGVLVKAPAEGGVELAAKTDALGVRTTSAAVSGGADGSGNLAAAEADVTRLRLGLEGTWRGLNLGAGELIPAPGGGHSP